MKPQTIASQEREKNAEKPTKNRAYDRKRAGETNDRKVVNVKLLADSEQDQLNDRTL